MEQFSSAMVSVNVHVAAAGLLSSGVRSLVTLRSCWDMTPLVMNVRYREMVTLGRWVTVMLYPLTTMEFLPVARVWNDGAVMAERTRSLLFSVCSNTATYVYSTPATRLPMVPSAPNVGCSGARLVPFSENVCPVKLVAWRPGMNISPAYSSGCPWVSVIGLKASTVCGILLSLMPTLLTCWMSGYVCCDVNGCFLSSVVMSCSWL